MNRRYPIEPLANYLRIELGIPGNPRCRRMQAPDDDTPRGLAALAMHLPATPDIDGPHMTIKQMERRRAIGLHWWEADRAATRLGLHPVTLWPTWFDDGNPEPPPLNQPDTDQQPALFATP